jgi:hypothetical protein
MYLYDSHHLAGVGLWQAVSVVNVRLACFRGIVSAADVLLQPREADAKLAVAT